MAHIFIGNFLILPTIITVSLPFKDFKDNLVLFVTIRKMLCRSSTKRNPMYLSYRRRRRQCFSARNAVH